ncbi:unnamed protein product [Pleuronectes platessa]|uniref:Uncharacterized protein n=1 Tax=Pleuronectes platessa TaxID=8262 RepID=A0A9N7UQC4_PLEPL|nr:unnamed protein product [Pleuronectes platessa]
MYQRSWNLFVFPLSHWDNCAPIMEKLVGPEMTFFLSLPHEMLNAPLAALRHMKPAELQRSRDHRYGGSDLHMGIEPAAGRPIASVQKERRASFFVFTQTEAGEKKKKQKKKKKKKKQKKKKKKKKKMKRTRLRLKRRSEEGFQSRGQRPIRASGLQNKFTENESSQKRDTRGTNIQEDERTELQIQIHEPPRPRSWNTSPLSTSQTLPELIQSQISNQFKLLHVLSGFYIVKLQLLLTINCT